MSQCRLHQAVLQGQENSKGDFREFVKRWPRDIDILHIDGTHDYDAVKRDFEQWSPLVKKGGAILMHDTCSYREHVGKLFDEIEGYHKHNFEHAMGLGVLTKDKKLAAAIKEWDAPTLREQAADYGVTI